MAQNAPGKAHREGISIMELADMFPNEEAARVWFEAHVWPDGRHCPRCGSTRTHEASHAKSPYRCTDCRAYFSVKTGTALEGSKIPLRKWVFAIYLEVTSLKGVASMKLHRDIKVTQKTAWFMLHRLREAWANEKSEQFSGPVEADETYMGGRRANMPKKKRKELTGRGAVGKTVVVGVKDRATNRVSAAVVEGTDAKTLQGFIEDRVGGAAQVFTDEHGGYVGMVFDHERVNHSAGEYVRKQKGGPLIHTQGIESFWSMLKRAHKGTFHKISEKHMNRYVGEFVGRHNIRLRDTIDMMQSVAIGMAGKRLRYRDLIADNGLPSGARSG